MPSHPSCPRALGRPRLRPSLCPSWYHPVPGLQTHTALSPQEGEAATWLGFKTRSFSWEGGPSSLGMYLLASRLQAWPLALLLRLWFLGFFLLLAGQLHLLLPLLVSLLFLFPVLLLYLLFFSFVITLLWLYLPPLLLWKWQSQGGRKHVRLPRVAGEERQLHQVALVVHTTTARKEGWTVKTTHRVQQAWQAAQAFLSSSAHDVLGPASPAMQSVQYSQERFAHFQGLVVKDGGRR